MDEHNLCFTGNGQAAIVFDEDSGVFVDPDAEHFWVGHYQAKEAIVTLADKEVLVENEVRDEAEAFADTDLRTVENFQVGIAGHHRVGQNGCTGTCSAKRCSAGVFFADHLEQLLVGKHVHDPVLIAAGEEYARGIF